MTTLPICTYCRYPADTIDHLEPVSRQTNRRHKGKATARGLMVPCCHQCNVLLGAAPVFTIRGRAAYLIMRYAELDDSPVMIADKMRALVHVAAGFPLEPELIEMEARYRHRLAELAAEREEDDSPLTYAERLKFILAAGDMHDAQQPKPAKKSRL